VVFSIMANQAKGLLKPFYAVQDAITEAIVDMP
jgi:hypothetical protein